MDCRVAYLPHPPLGLHSPGLNERILLCLLGLGGGWRLGLGLLDTLNIELKKNPKKFSMVHNSQLILQSPQGRLDLSCPLTTYI